MPKQDRLLIRNPLLWDFNREICRGEDSLASIVGKENVSHCNRQDHTGMTIVYTRVLIDGKYPNYFTYHTFSQEPRMEEETYEALDSASHLPIKSRRRVLRPGIPPALDIAIEPILMTNNFEEDKLYGMEKGREKNLAAVKFYDLLKQAFPGRKIMLRNPQTGALIEYEGIIEEIRNEYRTGGK